ncbi:P-loop containing nucleoside triphosphate hydrolase protein [Pisolithus microcarpus]|nr:P-loop containing nucleoside triphosphate hydrolase protein [Pisolithus microcarpus]
MAPKQKNLNPSGLGRAIINRRVKDARERQESGLYTTDVDPTSRLRSVTQEKDLDEFLNTAQLAGMEFTAERRNIKIIQSPAGSSHNPFLLSDQEEQSTLVKHQENKSKLRVPRRPPWTKSITTAQLDRQEKNAFLEWRRGLARVIERSHLVVQIVDARNPLRFRCEDLEAYVKDVEGAEGEAGTGNNLRKNLLLINKADLLTATQRRIWADYFDSEGIQYAFFSAANAVALQKLRHDVPTQPDARQLQAEQASDEDTDSSSEGQHTPHDKGSANGSDSEADRYVHTEEDSPDGRDSRTKVLSVLQLEELFLSSAPDLSLFADRSGSPPTKLVVGLVGYPNVGKSSTINALLGEKKVSVSSTPGKTKHFQTIHLSSTIILCDCPGLVFPQFATTKAALVCDGVLPIDQMREYTGPVALVAKRVPKEVLEATYGLSIRVRGKEEGGDGRIAAEDLLVAYASARGFMRSGQGNPDEARAARYILKDYVSGKLLFCHPPAGVSEDMFNARTHELALRCMAGKKRAPLTRVGKGADTFKTTPVASHPLVRGAGKHGQQFTRNRMYPHQNMVGDDGLATEEMNGKKYHKKMRRVKQRSGKGYD